MQISRTLFFLPYCIVGFLSSWYNHLLVLLSYMDLEVSGDFMSVFSIKWFCCSVTKSCPTLWDSMDCSTPGFPVLHYLPEFAQTHVHWVNNAIQPSRLLLPSSLPALILYQHQGLRIRWPKYWSFSFSISPSNEYLGLISFKIDWFDLLVVQGFWRVFST